MSFLFLNYLGHIVKIIKLKLLSLASGTIKELIHQSRIYAEKMNTEIASAVSDTETIGQQPIVILVIMEIKSLTGIRSI